MASFRKIRSILLQSFDNGDISEDELLLYDVNTSKNPDVPYESYGKFDLKIWMTVSVYPSFIFIRVTFSSSLRPYIFLTTLQLSTRSNMQWKT